MSDVLFDHRRENLFFFVYSTVYSIKLIVNDINVHYRFVVAISLERQMAKTNRTVYGGLNKHGRLRTLIYLPVHEFFVDLHVF